MKNLTGWIFAVAAVSFIVPGVVWAQGEYSGFLDDYPAMEQDADRPGAMIWRKPGLDLGKYDRVLIEEITMFLDAKSKYKGMKPDRMKAITDAFRHVLTNELEPEYPTVSKPGPGVLWVRLAVADVRLAKKKRSILNFTPAGFALRAIQDAAGTTVLLQSATLEAEMLDSHTGERLAVLVDRQSAATGSKVASWDTLNETLVFYAKRFRSRLDKAHGR